MAHPVDIYVGKRLQEYRKSIGLSQKELGQKIGVTFQQIQKYELAQNRLSISRLYEIAQVFNVPVAYFLRGYGCKGELPQEPHHRITDHCLNDRLD